MLFQLLWEESRRGVVGVLVQEERGQTSSGGRIGACHTSWQRIFAFSKQFLCVSEWLKENFRQTVMEEATEFIASLLEVISVLPQLQ